jgi:hypothetical protein
VPPEQHFKPEREVRMLRDVNGWADRERGEKWGLSAGQTYLIDTDKADELIVKRWAEGELSRTYSLDEQAEVAASAHETVWRGELWSRLEERRRRLDKG